MISLTRSIRASHVAHLQDWLGGFVKEFERVARLDDLAEIRKKVAASVTEMKEYRAAVEKETPAANEQLRAELHEFRDRLAAAETLASTDPLTGIANHREGERQLQERIRSGQHFCILVFDLNRFKIINDRWGHQWGDHVLKTFAARLVAQVREEDVVCRWGGDEFLVILHYHMALGARFITSASTPLWVLPSTGTARPVNSCLPVPTRCSTTRRRRRRRPAVKSIQLW